MRAIHDLSDPDRLLNELQAARLLGLSSRTLQAWRSRGAGPAYVRAGRAVRYRRSDLVGWTQTMTVASQDTIQWGSQ
jgi:predicted DNA-binding transcriptional regulator AlpA